MSSGKGRPLTRSEIMARIGSKDTKPELAMRKALRDAGLVGYRKNLRGVPGTPDVAYTRYKLAVFVDGDFWHGRYFERDRARLAAGRNGGFWTGKITRNMERDARDCVALEGSGWTVLRFWASDVLSDAGTCVALVGKTLTELGRGMPGRRQGGAV